MTGMTACRDVLGRLSDYFDGRIAAGDPDGAVMDAHLRVCASCSDALSDFGRLREALRPPAERLPDPEGFGRRLVTRLATDCGEVLERLSDHFDGRLAAGDPGRALLEDHLQVCAACAAALADLGRIREALRPPAERLPDPGGFERRLHARLAPRRLRRWMPAAAAAALAVSFGWAGWGGRPGATPTIEPAFPVPSARTLPPASAPAHEAAHVRPPPATPDLLGTPPAASMADAALARDLEDLTDELGLVRASPDTDALYADLLSLRDRDHPGLRTVAYAP